MVKKPSKRARETSVFMALIFTGILLLSFVSVWAIEYDWNNYGTTELLYETDGSTIFSSYEFEEPTSFTMQPCMRITGGLQEQYNRTPVYNGGSEWVMSMNDTALNYVSGNYYIDIPNLDDWLISNIEVNFTENTDPSYYTKITMTSFDTSGGIINGSSVISHDIVNSIDYEVGDGWFNRSINIPMQEGLTLYNNAQGKDNSALFLLYYDDGSDWDDWAWKISIKIYGSQVEDISLQKTIAWAVGGCSVINIIAVIFMADQYDIIPRKDLNRYVGSRRKR